MRMRYRRVAELLTELENVLKAAELWSAERPSDFALNSSQPFARDTLDFEQWLQFILIPRLTRVVEQQASLPESMAVSPMAQMSLPGEMPVHIILQQLDEAVSNG